MPDAPSGFAREDELVDNDLVEVWDLEARDLEVWQARSGDRSWVVEPL